jgi:hypothetical protein
MRMGESKPTLFKLVKGEKYQEAYRVEGKKRRMHKRDKFGRVSKMTK